MLISSAAFVGRGRLLVAIFRLILILHELVSDLYLLMIGAYVRREPTMKSCEIECSGEHAVVARQVLAWWRNQGVVHSSYRGGLAQEIAPAGVRTAAPV